MSATGGTLDRHRQAERKRLTRFGFRNIVGRYAQKAGNIEPSLKEKKITPHTFRHTTAFPILRSTHNIKDVQEWLGHKDLNTTNRYCTSDPETKREALASFRSPSIPAEPAKWKTKDALAFLTHLTHIESARIM